MMRVDWDSAVEALHQGQVILHATEGVFGLACRADSQTACAALAATKKRPDGKGFIILPQSLQQISEWIQPLSESDLEKLSQFWPGHYTFLLPKAPLCPTWLGVGFNTLAVRLTPHPQVQQLLKALPFPICSTSANISGEEASCSSESAAQVFPDIPLLEGTTLGLNQPSQIHDLASGKRLR